MASNPAKTREHMFSIQLKSIDDLKSVALPNDYEGTVLLEGFLGLLENVNFTEGIMLEIKGSSGSFRMDLSKKEFRRLLPKKTFSGNKK